MQIVPAIRSRLRLAFLPLAAACLFTMTAPADAQDDSEKKTKIVEKLDQIPPRSHRQLKEPMANLPDGYKARIEISTFFDYGHGESTQTMVPFVSSFVPVNPQGKADGEELVMDKRGSIVSRIQWTNGVKDGPERIFHAVWPKYYEAARIPWQNGVIQGVKKTFYEDGKVKSETPYKDGEPHGVAKSYSKAGKVTRKSVMKNGVRDGLLVDYWPQTGEKRREIQYDMGKVQGVTKEYHPNGQLRRAVPFKNNVIHGEEKRFGEDGTPEKSRYWLAGDLVSKTEFELKYKE